MAHAKILLELDYKVDEIQGCALAMVKNPGKFNGWNSEWKLQYLSTVLRGEPPYIEQWITPPEPPPVYETHAYDDWVMVYGKKAIERGVWDGIYGPINEPYRLNDKAIGIILGEEYAQRSLAHRASISASPGL